MTSQIATQLRQWAQQKRLLWQNHPSFAGVRLCRLVGADESEGFLTSLLVDLAPGAVMAKHRHPNEVEQHLALEGDGIATLCGVSLPYVPGALTVIPKASEHSVTAGANGLVLLAVFSPSPK